MAQWFYGMETGQAKVKCDFRVGGKYAIEMSNPEITCTPSGEYLEIVPPRKIVFTWNSPGVCDRGASSDHRIAQKRGRGLNSS